jgi:type I restriction enzyme, S subunit
MSNPILSTLDRLVVDTKDGDWGQDVLSAGFTPYRVIRGADFPAVRRGDISTVPLRYLSEQTVARRTLQSGDIIIETAGGSRDRSTGRTVFIDEALLSRIGGPATCASFARFLRVDASKADPRFIYWYLQNLHASGGMWEHQVQHTGVARFQYTHFASTHQIPLPSRWEQSAIAEVLGALDDKIAVNDRITATVLNLADAFFEETATGLPFGPNSFGTVASVYGGGTPSTSQPSYWNGGIAWTTPTDVTALKAPYLFKTSRTITEEGLANCASRLYPAGSIFMTSRATIGAFAVPQIPAAVNQGFIVVVPPREELRWWLFHEMRSQVDEMLSLANGSTFLELSRKNFKAMPARIAPSEVLARFDAKVAPLHRRAAEAAAESTALLELRDYLLPRIISGEIRVRDARKAIEDVT